MILAWTHRPTNVQPVTNVVWTFRLVPPKGVTNCPTSQTTQLGQTVQPTVQVTLAQRWTLEPLRALWGPRAKRSFSTSYRPNASARPFAADCVSAADKGDS